MRYVSIVFALLVVLAFSLRAQEPPEIDGFQFPFTGNVQQICDFGILGSCYYSDQYHLAEDYDLSVNSPVYACANGIVREAQNHSGYGGTVLIEHKLPSGEYVVSLYGHLFESTLPVSPGDVVQRGQLIGYVADSQNNGGYSPHLHFGISKGIYKDLPPENISCDGEWIYHGYSTIICAVDEWYDPSDFINSHPALVGYYNQSPSWHTDGTSQAFVDAFNSLKSQGIDLGTPASFNGSTQYVHTKGTKQWLMQYFYKENSGRVHDYSLLVYNPSSGQCYAIHSGFWGHTVENELWNFFNPPSSNESGSNPAVQYFGPGAQTNNARLEWSEAGGFKEYDENGNIVNQCNLTFENYAGGGELDVYHHGEFVTTTGQTIQRPGNHYYADFKIAVDGGMDPVDAFTLDGNKIVYVNGDKTAEIVSISGTPNPADLNETVQFQFDIKETSGVNTVTFPHIEILIENDAFQNFYLQEIVTDFTLNPGQTRTLTHSVFFSEADFPPDNYSVYLRWNDGQGNYFTVESADGMDYPYHESVGQAGMPQVKVLAATDPAYAGQDWHTDFDLTPQSGQTVVNDTIRVYYAEPGDINRVLWGEWHDVDIADGEVRHFTTVPQSAPGIGTYEIKVYSVTNGTESLLPAQSGADNTLTVYVQEQNPGNGKAETNEFYPSNSPTKDQPYEILIRIYETTNISSVTLPEVRLTLYDTLGTIKSDLDTFYNVYLEPDGYFSHQQYYTFRDSGRQAIGLRYTRDGVSWDTLETFEFQFDRPGPSNPYEFTVITPDTGLSDTTSVPDGAVLSKIYPNKDTYYGTSYYQTGNPNSEYIWTGGWSDRYDAFLDWDLLNIPPDSLVSVKLCLTVAAVPENDPAHYLYRITEPWEESEVSESNHPAYSTSDRINMPSTNYAEVGDVEKIDITDLYRNWIDGTYPAYGLMISPNNTNNTVTYYYSTDHADSTLWPYLEVIYYPLSQDQFIVNHPTLLNGLVSYWDMEIDSSVCVDNHGENNLTILGGTKENGNPGYSMRLDNDSVNTAETIITASEQYTQYNDLDGTYYQTFVVSKPIILTKVSIYTREFDNSTIRLYVTDNEGNELDYWQGNLNAWSWNNVGLNAQNVELQPGKIYRFYQKLVSWGGGATQYYLSNTDYYPDGFYSRGSYVEMAFRIWGKDSPCYLSITDSAQSGLDISGSLTAAAWVNVEQTNGNVNIMSKGDVYNDGAFNLMLYDAGSSFKVGSRLFDADNNYIDSRTSTTIPLNTWVYIAMTWQEDAGSGVKLYINGHEEQSYEVFQSGITAINNSNSPLLVGSGIDNGNYTDLFTGRIDGVGIWSRVLTADEILDLYNSGSGLYYSDSESNTSDSSAVSNAPMCIVDHPTLSDGLLSYWPFDEESGKRYDSHGTNDLKDCNSVSFKQGKQGNAADFVKPNSEYLEGGKDLDLTSNQSWSFWWKPDHVNITQYFWTTKNVLNNYGTCFYWNDHGHFVFRIDKSNDYSESNFDYSLSANQWYHIVLVYDRSNRTVELFVNNVSLGISRNVVQNDRGGGGVRISHKYSNSGGGTDCYIDGLLDEYSVWNRTLTYQEVADLYNDGNGLPYSSQSLSKKPGTDGVVSLGENIPTQYSLLQNYPNPFNPKTTIRYALPEDAHVQIVVYNILGQRVAKLVDAFKPAGYHQVVWDAGDLASGIYIYQMTSNNGYFIQTKKLLLLK